MSRFGRLSLRARLLLIALGLLAASLAVGNTVVVALLDQYQTTGSMARSARSRRSCRWPAALGPS